MSRGCEQAGKENRISGRILHGLLMITLLARILNVDSHRVFFTLAKQDYIACNVYLYRLFFPPGDEISVLPGRKLEPSESPAFFF